MLNNQEIVYLIGLVISGIIAILSFILHFIFKTRRQNHFNTQKNQEGVWQFTKRNFWIFTGLFCFVMAFTFLMFLIGLN